MDTYTENVQSVKSLIDRALARARELVAEASTDELEVLVHGPITPAKARAVASAQWLREMWARTDLDVDKPENAAQREAILAERAALEDIYTAAVEAGIFTRVEIEGDLAELKALAEAGNHYAAVALPLAAAGWAVMPGRDEDELRKRARYFYKFWTGEDRRRQLPREVLHHAEMHPDVAVLWLVDSGPVILAAVDVDDLDLLPWVLATFGEPLFTVSTGRPGGGVHLYYWADSYVTGRNGAIGPLSAFHFDGLALDGDTGLVKKPKREGTSPIDVKCRRGYPVAPWSLHKSGAVYTPDRDLPEVMGRIAQGIGRFDNELYEVMVAEVKQLRRERKPGRAAAKSKKSAKATDKPASSQKPRKAPTVRDRVKAALDFDYTPPPDDSLDDLMALDESEPTQAEEPVELDPEEAWRAAEAESQEGQEDYFDLDDEGQPILPVRPPAAAPKPSKVAPVNPATFWDALPKDLSKIRRVRCVDNLAVLDGEPFFQWAASSAAGLSYDAWRGGLQAIVALAGEDGRPFAQLFSALDPARYHPAECDKAYSDAIESVRQCGAPMRYETLAAAGWPGDVPTAIRSPADRLRCFLEGTFGPGEEAIAIPDDECIPPAGGYGAPYIGRLNPLIEIGTLCLLLLAEPGSGKTTSMDKLAAQYPRSVKIVPRRALTNPRYRRVRWLTEDRVECCLPSILKKLKLPPRDPRKPRILLLDEWPTILAMIVSRKFGSAPALLRKLRALIAACDLVVAAGADCTLRERDMLIELGVPAEGLKIVKHLPRVPWAEAIRLGSMAEVLWVVDTSIQQGKRVFLSSTVKSTVEKVAAQIRKRNPEIQPLALVGGKEWTPPERWGCYGSILTSPVGSVGVSYSDRDGAPFDVEITLGEPRGSLLDWTEIKQGASRPRRSQQPDAPPRTLYYFIPCREPAAELDRTSDLAEIERLEHARYERGARALRKHGYGPKSSDPTTERLFVLSEQVMRIRCRNQRELFEAWLSREGVKLSTFYLTTATEMMNARDLFFDFVKAGKQAREAKVKAVLDAPDLHRHAAVRLQRKGELTEEQESALARFKVLNELGAAGLTEASVLCNAHGRRTRQAMLFSAVRLVEEGQEKCLAAEDYSAYVAGDITRVKSLGVVAHLVHRLLVAAGAPVRDLVAPLRIGASHTTSLDDDPQPVVRLPTEAELAEAREAVAAWRWDKAGLLLGELYDKLKAILDEEEGNRDLLAMFGIRSALGFVSDAGWIEDPVRLIGNLLGGLGLKSEKPKDTRRGGEHVRIYNLDMAVYDEAVGLTDRTNRKLSGLPVEEPVEIGTRVRGKALVLDVPAWRPRGEDDAPTAEELEALYAPDQAEGEYGEVPDWYTQQQAQQEDDGEMNENDYWQQEADGEPDEGDYGQPEWPQPEEGEAWAAK
jgi:hypothetical protein